MPKILSITNKLLSLRGRMSITDEAGNVVYDAIGEFAFISPTWRINKGIDEIAIVRRKIFAWAPTWIVTSEIGDFTIKRKILSWVRRYTILYGPFDGATVEGNIWDLKFLISQKERTIAHAKGKILTLRDRHNIEILESDDFSEIFTVIIMVALHLERNSESDDGDSSFSSHTHM